MTHKHSILKLFLTSGTYYVQLNDNLYPVKETVALVISDKEGLEIRKCNSLKEMQETSLADKENPSS